MNQTVSCKLSPFALGISLAIIASLLSFLTGFILYMSSQEIPFVALIGATSISYKPSSITPWISSFVAFINFFGLGFVVAWFYNFIRLYLYK